MIILSVVKNKAVEEVLDKEFDVISFEIVYNPWNTSFEMVNVLATEEVQIRNSETSYGLQIVDIALWLMKKYLDHPVRQIRDKCNNLINAITLNGQLTQFTEQQLEENLMDMTKEIRDIPFTQIELDNGKSIVSKNEEIRL